MNNSVKHIAAAALILNATLALAWNPLNSKLQMYECKNLHAAMKCDSSCKRLDDAKVEFKVNVDKSFVTLIRYEDGNQAGSRPLEGCKVIDTNNWSCEEDSTIASTYRGGTYAMTNGQYYQWTVLRTAPKLKTDKGLYSEGSYCAK